MATRWARSARFTLVGGAVAPPSRSVPSSSASARLWWPSFSSCTAVSRKFCRAVALRVVSAACRRGASAPGERLVFFILRGAGDELPREHPAADRETPRVRRAGRASHRAGRPRGPPPGRSRRPADRRLCKRARRRLRRTASCWRTGNSCPFAEPTKSLPWNWSISPRVSAHEFAGRKSQRGKWRAERGPIGERGGSGSWQERGSVGRFTRGRKRSTRHTRRSGPLHRRVRRKIAESRSREPASRRSITLRPRARSVLPNQ